MNRIVRSLTALGASAALITLAPFSASAAPSLVNAAAASYDPGNGTLVQAQSPSTLTQANPNLTVTSAITACQGGPLTDYTGWSIGLYNADSAGNPTSNLSLTRTQLPVYPTVPLPAGIAPNNQNLNPFTVTNGNTGLYEFLLDSATNQTNAAATYVLITNAPPSSTLPKRRIKIALGATSGGNVAYTATPLDNMAINATVATPAAISGTFPIVRTSASGNFAVFQLPVSECPTNAIGVTKTANVATAQVGDTVVYSVAVTNQSLTAIAAPTVTDILPLGIMYVGGSVRAGITGAAVPATATLAGSRLVMTTTASIPPSAVLTFVYAAIISPDALRGNAQNVAVADGSIGASPVHGGPASYTLKLDPGILSDCGTIIGRVYIDKPLQGIDRRQQPGVPNAVVYFDDGVRITTDKNGLYHYPGCAHPGWRTAALDLQSVKGYTLSPDIYIAAKNGQSQWGHLEPSGLIKINFAVVPAKERAR
jgi:uncharacterized repeat protein (TIGR01451 family)